VAVAVVVVAMGGCYGWLLGWLLWMVVMGGTWRAGVGTGGGGWTDRGL